MRGVLMANEDGRDPVAAATARDPEESPPGPDHVAMRETYDMYSAMAYVLAGPLTFGPIGWILDRLLGTSFVLPVGLLAGMFLSLYYVWFRYGTR